MGGPACAVCTNPHDTHETEASIVHMHPRLADEELERGRRGTCPEHGTGIWTQAAPCETSLGTSGSQSGSGASLMVTLASSGEGRGCA